MEEHEMTPGITDVLEEKLPELLRKVVSEVMKGFAIIEPYLGWFSEDARGKFANVSGHQIVAVLKKVDWDEAWVRMFIKNFLIIMYKLDEKWLPKWSMEPPVNEAKK